MAWRDQIDQREYDTGQGISLGETHIGIPGIGGQATIDPIDPCNDVSIVSGSRQGDSQNSRLPRRYSGLGPARARYRHPISLGL